MKNLENFDVQELKPQEMANTNGGFWFVAALLVVAVIFALDGNENTSTTITDGVNEQRIGN